MHSRILEIPILYQGVLLSAIYFLAENATPIPDVEEVSGPKGTELSRTPIELKNGEWNLKVVPWIGGRIMSMTHIPSGTLIIIRNIFNLFIGNVQVACVFPCDTLIK